MISRIADPNFVSRCLTERFPVQLGFHRIRIGMVSCVNFNMAYDPCVDLTAEDSAQWTTIAGDWHRPLKRCFLQVTPNSAFWTNVVESFFSALARCQLKGDVFQSRVDLQTASNGYIEVHNNAPRPLVWPQEANDILSRVAHLNQGLGSLH